MTNSPNTITLISSGRTKELVAGVAINPGYLLRLYTATTLKVKPHDIAYGHNAKLFAIEQEYLGKGITTQYAIGDTVIFGCFHTGDEVLARLAASAVAVVAGDPLVSAGDGTLQKGVPVTSAVGTNITTGILADVTATPTQTLINNNDKTIATYLGASIAVVGYALEAVDNSGGGAEVMIRVLVA